MKEFSFLSAWVRQRIAGQIGANLA